MDEGKGAFGDTAYMQSVLDGLRHGTEDGKLHAMGTARVGEALNAKRIPVIKKQAISAYDPRVIEVTGLTMMMTAQGADHTAGNLPSYDSKDKGTDELVGVSLEIQVLCASADSLGLCIFGRSVTNEQLDFITEAINDAHGTSLETSFYEDLGRQALIHEARFNRDAGFSEADDDLPEFFYSEALPPSDRAGRFHTSDVNEAARHWWSTTH